MVICLERGADCLRTVQLMPLLSQKNPVTMCRVVFPSFNLGQVVHTHVPLTEQYSLVLGEGAVMPCGLEGNRRSDVHWPCITDFSGSSTYGLFTLKFYPGVFALGIPFVG